MAKDRNNKLLEIAQARHQNQAQLYVSLHDKFLASSPSSIGSMVSTVAGGVVATAGATAGATSTAVGAMMDMANSATSLGTSAVSWLTAPPTQPTEPVALLDSGYDSDDGSVSSFQSGYDDTADNDASQLGGPMAALSLSGDAYREGPP